MPVVLHICTRYLRGGSESRIRDMMRAIPEAEHHLVVGGGSDMALVRKQSPAQRVLAEPSLIREVNPITDIRCLFRLRSLIERTAPTVVVTHQSKAGVLGRLAARTTGGVPAVHSLSMASFGPGYSRHQDLLFRIVERVLAPMTTAYLVVGRDLADRFAALGIPRDKFHVVRSGVRLEHSEESKSELRRRLGARHGISPDVPWVVYVGSLEQRKNVHDLPRLTDELNRVMPERRPHLLVVGEGPLQDRIEAEAEALGLREQITLTGYAEDAIDYIRAADVMVLLSSAEGLPQVLVQAGAVGTPFVAYSVDGLRELIDLGADGSMVQPHDISALAGEITGKLTGVESTGRIDRGSWSPTAIAGNYRAFFRDLPGFSLISCL